MQAQAPVRVDGQILFEEIIQLCDNIIASFTQLFPSRMEMFLYAFYVWSCILFYITKFANFMLGMIITFLPTLLMPNVSTKSPVRILRAVDEKGTDITKRLNMFMKFKWDNDMCDDKGGVDLDKFSDYIGSSIIWIAYILEYEINDSTYNNFMMLINDIEKNADNTSDLTTTCENYNYPLEYFKKCIKFVVINTSKKVIYKLKKNTKDLEPESILFGEVDFF